MSCLTDNQAALIALVLIAVCAIFAPANKEIYIAAVSAIGGWMSKGGA